jgi:hypothetical protein
MSPIVTKLLSFFCALMLLAGCAALRVEEQPSAGPVSSEGKNLCLLDSEECPARKMTIIELIEGLREELAKGEAVYTPAELRRLATKLREYEIMYDRLMFGNSD